MNSRTNVPSVILAAIASLFATCSPATEMIKVGLSVPLSGSGAIWGKSAEWMCDAAAKEIQQAGGVRVKDQTYQFKCLAYDNKYNAAEGARVAQTLMNRDGVRYIFALGTAPILAAQSLTERGGVLLFNTSWGTRGKGPNFPLSFSVVNTPVEIMPTLVQYVTKTYSGAKTIAMLNVNDASGQQNESLTRPLWERAGVKVLVADHYERGTTEFQPIAARLASVKPAIIDLGSAPPADAGQIFKELDVLGYRGVKVLDDGTGTDGLVATGGKAADGVLMAAAIPFDGPGTSRQQRKLNDEARAALGVSLDLPSIGAYDALYMLKAGLEKAQSTEPKEIATALPTAKFRTFYGGETRLGGKSIYGADIQPMLPVFITQVQNGHVVERAKIEQQRP